MIKLYTLPGCGVCKVMKNKMEANQIKYEEFNLEEYATELNTERAPVLELEDGTFLYTPFEINAWIKEVEKNGHQG